MASRQFCGSDAPRYRVFVGNLPKTTLQSHLEDILDGCKISEIQMVRDSETDEFRGFSYVELKDEESYNRALSYDGTIVNGNEVRVNNADRRGARGTRGGQGPPHGYSGPNNGRGGGGGNYGERRDYGGRPSNMRGGRIGQGERFDQNRQRPGGYRPRVQPGNGFQENSEPVAPSNNHSDYLPRPNFDAADRPRLSIKPRSQVVPLEDRDLTDRARSIFGVGKPRTASPDRKPNGANDEN